MKKSIDTRPFTKEPMIVRSKEELVAALQSPSGIEEGTIVIEWHRPSGVTTYRLNPKEVLGGSFTSKLDHFAFLDRHYAAIARKARALSEESCS